MKSFVLSLIVLYSTFSWSKVMYVGSEPEDINVFANSKIIFKFQEPVRTISKAEKFKIQPLSPPDYSVLTIEPRGVTGSSLITFFLTDGSSVSTRLVIVPTKGKGPTVYEFKPKAMLGSPFISKIELLKAMIREDSVPGYKIENRDTPVSIPYEGVRATLKSVYVGKEAHGYIYELKNVTRRFTYTIDLSKLTLGSPNLAIFSEIHDSELTPGKRTILHVIARPASLYRQVVLPVRWESEKEKP